jgi:hypothetical protein
MLRSDAAWHSPSPHLKAVSYGACGYCPRRSATGLLIVESMGRLAHVISSQPVEGSTMFRKKVPVAAKSRLDIKREIEEGIRREVRHEQPQSLNPNGWNTFVTPGLLELFDDLVWFGAAVDWMVGDPWTIEETQITSVMRPEYPALGRTYRVFYNQVHMGILDVCQGCNPQRGNNIGYANARVRLSHMRLVPFREAHRLIFNLALVIGDQDDAANPELARAICLGENRQYPPPHAIARQRAGSEAESALIEFFWDSSRTSDGELGFEFWASGPCTVYRNQAKHWARHSVDPFSLRERDAIADHGE